MKKKLSYKVPKLNSELSLFEDKTLIWAAEKIFAQTALGQLRASLPLQELVSYFRPYYEKECAGRTKNLGRSSWFDIEGGLCLQFLKSYYNGLSDAKLIEQLNGSHDMQRFCGIQLPISRRIKDKDIVGRWRSFFARYMDIEQLQRIFLNGWKGDISTPQVRMSDATCYESYVKYPTSVNLLWDSTEWLAAQIGRFVKSLKSVKKPDNQYVKISEEVKTYQRLRRKPTKRTRNIIGKLLRLEERMINQLQEIVNAHRQDSSLVEGGWTDKHDEKLRLCRKIIKQQKALRNDPTKSIPDRICCWSRPYIRPIVRGKENKKVEFGYFVNTIYVDGIQLIEHAECKMYHEGNRLPYCVIKYQNELGKCQTFAGDQKYSTNKNRAFCKKRGIQTSFRSKGPQPKDEDKKQERLLRKTLGTIRSTHLEGAYGNEKNHYGLKKVKAKGEKNELAWIFFGLFTANAVCIAKKRQEKANNKIKNKPSPQPKMSLALSPIKKAA